MWFILLRQWHALFVTYVKRYKHGETNNLNDFYFKNIREGHSNRLNDLVKFYFIKMIMFKHALEQLLL